MFEVFSVRTFLFRCLSLLFLCVLREQAYTCLPKQWPHDNIGAFVFAVNAFKISQMYSILLYYICVFVAIVCVLLFFIVYNLHSSNISHNKPDELLLSIVPLTIRNMKHHKLIDCHINCLSSTMVHN